MPDTSPTPVDRCASRYQPSPIQCALDAHTSGRHRNEWQSWEDEDAIGPDSERIRELEAELAELGDLADKTADDLEGAKLHIGRLHAGLLGPDEIVVSRKDLQYVLNYGSPSNSDISRPWWSARGRLLVALHAALSQPHPEETP